MKAKNLPAIIINASLWLLATNAHSQTTFANFHTFGALTIYGTNPDGANPYGGLIVSGSTMYGMTTYGGKSSGTIFRINMDGSGFTNLYSFSEMTFNSSLQNGTNRDGAGPSGELVLSGSNLYGVTQIGGAMGTGTIFKIGTDGSNYTVLHTFSVPTYDSTSELYTNADGATPYAGLILSGSTLYGTTAGGGGGSSGVVFSLDVSGQPFSTLYNFTAAMPATTGWYTNSDGSFPRGSLCLLGGFLYGTTQSGGTNGVGTIFKINAGGMNFTNLHAFGRPAYDYSQSAYTNRDGIYPECGLVSDGGALYGTTYNGARTGYGTVFRMDSSGGGFTNLYDFTYGDDGANLQSGLILSNNVLYGTAENGGSAGYGTVFQLNTNGTGFSTVHAFSQLNQDAAGNNTNSDGAYPDAKLMLAGGTLYGTTSGGGTNGHGTVFAVNPPAASGLIRLNIQLSTTNLILTWSNSAYVLQMATTVNGSYMDITNATNPYTNTTAESSKFFRLHLP